jgi:hypothetical protein
MMMVTLGMVVLEALLLEDLFFGKSIEDIFAAVMARDSVEMMEKSGVFSPRELDLVRLMRLVLVEGASADLMGDRGRVVSDLMTVVDVMSADVARNFQKSDMTKRRGMVVPL